MLFGAHALLVEHDLSENRCPLFGIMLYWWSMIFSENRCPLFGIMLYWWSMIFSENRCPLFGIML